MFKLKPKKQPYIKVRYKVDYPAAGIKAGSVVPIAYRSWGNVPGNIKAITELVEGPETLQELKEKETEALQELNTKVGEVIKKEVAKKKTKK